MEAFQASDAYSDVEASNSLSLVDIVGVVRPSWQDSFLEERLLQGVAVNGEGAAAPEFVGFAASAVVVVSYTLQWDNISNIAHTTQFRRRSMQCAFQKS